MVPASDLDPHERSREGRSRAPPCTHPSLGSPTGWASGVVRRNAGGSHSSLDRGVIVGAPGSPGSADDVDVPAVLEESVEDSLSEVGVVKDAAPVLERLVGGEDHWPLQAVTGFDDGVEDVGGVGGVRKVADLVDDEDLGGDEGLDRGGRAR